MCLAHGHSLALTAPSIVMADGDTDEFEDYIHYDSIYEVCSVDYGNGTITTRRVNQNGDNMTASKTPAYGVMKTQEYHRIPIDDGFVMINVDTAGVARVVMSQWSHPHPIPLALIAAAVDDWQEQEMQRKAQKAATSAEAARKRREAAKSNDTFLESLDKDGIKITSDPNIPPGEIKFRNPVSQWKKPGVWDSILDAHRQRELDEAQRILKKWQVEQLPPRVVVALDPAPAPPPAFAVGDQVMVRLSPVEEQRAVVSWIAAPDTARDVIVTLHGVHKIVMKSDCRKVDPVPMPAPTTSVEPRVKVYCQGEELP